MALNGSTHVVLIDVRVGKGADTAAQKLRQVGTATEMAGVKAEKTKREFASLAGAFTALFAAGMIKRGIEAVVKPAADYTLELSRMRAVTGATDKEMQKYEATAKRVAAITPYGPTEMLGTLNELRRATGNTDVALASLQSTAQLSLASFGKLGLEGATRMTTETIKAFGLQANEVNDGMERLAALTLATGTHIESFQNVMARLGTTATVTGQSFDQMVMAATLAGRGVTQPTRNVQLLSSALKMLQQGKAREALMNIGVEVINPMTGGMRQLSDIFMDMARMMSTEPNKVRAAMAQAFGQRGGESVGAVLNQLTGQFKDTEGHVLKGAQVFDYLKKKVRESGGTLTRLGDEWLKSPTAKFELMSEKVEQAKIALGVSLIPILTRLGTVFGTLMHAFAAILENPVGKFIFTGASAGAALLAGGFALKALWFGIVRIFKNVASNLGLIAVESNAAAAGLSKMAAAGTAAAAGSAAAAGTSRLGKAKQFAAGLGGAVSGIGATAILGTSLLTEYFSGLGSTIQSKILTKTKRTWWESMWESGARKAMGADLSKMMDNLGRRTEKFTKDIELAKRAAKDMASHIQIGTEAYDKMRSGASSLSKYEPPEVKGRVFSTMEAKLRGAAGRLSGSDKKSAEYALAAAGTARTLMTKAAKGLISPTEQGQLMNALNTMGAVGWHFNKMFGPSIMGSSLLKSFGKDVTGQVAEMGGKENVEMMRIIARSRGMKYTTNDQQIPGTTAYAGGIGGAPGAMLMRDYPWHTKVFGKQNKQEAQQNMLVDIMGQQSQVGQQQSRTLEAILYQLKQPLKIEQSKSDPMGGQSREDFFPGT